MKKMMLLAAMMVGTASAAPAASGNITFNTQVNNVCAISGNASGGGTLSSVPATVNQSVTTADYNALQNPTSTATTGNIGYLQCTTGTPLTLTTTPSSGSAANTQSGNSSAAIVNTGLMNLTSGSNTLTGNYEAKLSTTAAASRNGDVWRGEFSFKPDGGQWNAPAGAYSGTLNFTITYN
ncbi:hypothetical protein E7T06_08970 [Deinococcus sp. Arct2-2]|uniref:hypothetical protein n=1 Tax=Deinococcus sp. Arct2-2 TaxID=2568653 RepID=UPI0010A58DBB|nr:hypothetical protein [Deinococcus sp. Arct2-2]THF70028.1 hypothetical protein E7T06_08970 [Deinococcus sp. Arct2-2]